MQLILELLLLGDVFGDAHHDQTLAGVGAMADEAFVAEPAHFAVRTNDPVLAILDRAFLDDLVEAALGVVQVIGVDAVAPLTVVSQQQARRTTEDALVGRADIDHVLGFPVERPQNSVHTHQQRAEQLFTLAQACDFCLSVHQG